MHTANIKHIIAIFLHLKLKKKLLTVKKYLQQHQNLIMPIYKP